MWLATYDACVWRHEAAGWTRFALQDGSSPVRAISVYEDKGGVLWVGTAESGAFRFDGTSFRPFLR